MSSNGHPTSIPLKGSDSSLEPQTEQTSNHTLSVRPWRLRTTPWSMIASHEFPGEGSETSPFIVDWIPSKDGFIDHDNPITFKPGYQWFLAVIAGSATLAVSMGSSMLSAAIPSIEKDYPGEKVMVCILVTSIYVCGFVIGPFVWSPCSELFGRRATYIWSYIPFVIFAAACCAAQSITQLLVLRFFAGAFGASAMTNSGGVIADIFPAEKRGLALAVFAIAPFMGPAIGPVAGGFLGQYEGWRWVAAVIALFAASVTLAGILFLPETFPPVLLRSRAERLSKVTGLVYRSKINLAGSTNKKDVFMKALAKPWGLLFGEPIVALMAAYLSLVYAVLYGSFDDFECIDTQTELESCGGCASGYFESDSKLQGVDCTALPGVLNTAVTCLKGQCLVTECLADYDLIDGRCVAKAD